MEISMQESTRKNRFTLCVAAALLLLIMACSDHGLEPAPEGFIAGSITYLGGVAAWPDTTEWVRVAAFTKVPRSLFEIVQNPPTFSDTLPRFVDAYDYQFRVPAGRYEWVVLAWKPKLKNPLDVDLSGTDTLGIYLDPNDSTKYGVVPVLPEQITAGIDIVADFSRLTPPSPILPKQPNADKPQPKVKAHPDESGQSRKAAQRKNT
jgi:hypothetical protein